MCVRTSRSRRAQKKKWCLAVLIPIAVPCLGSCGCFDCESELSRVARRRAFTLTSARILCSGWGAYHSIVKAPSDIDEKDVSVRFVTGPCGGEYRYLHLVRVPDKSLSVPLLAAEFVRKFDLAPGFQSPRHSALDRRHDDNRCARLLHRRARFSRFAETLF